MDLTVEVDLMK